MKRAFLIMVLTTGSTACASHTGVIQLSSETFMISKQQATGFPGLGNMKAELIAEGRLFCKNKNTEFKLIDTKETQPPYILGNYPRSEIMFNCVKFDYLNLN
jgi:hypothetical protein